MKRAKLAHDGRQIERTREATAGDELRDLSPDPGELAADTASFNATLRAQLRAAREAREHGDPPAPETFTLTRGELEHFTASVRTIRASFTTHRLARARRRSSTRRPTCRPAARRRGAGRPRRAAARSSARSGDSGGSDPGDGAGDCPSAGCLNVGSLSAGTGGSHRHTGRHAARSSSRERGRR